MSPQFLMGLPAENAKWSDANFFIETRFGLRKHVQFFFYWMDMDGPRRNNMAYILGSIIKGAFLNAFSFRNVLKYFEKS